MVLMVHFCVFEWIFPKKTFDKAETSTKLMALLLQQGVEKIDRLRHRENGGGAVIFIFFRGPCMKKQHAGFPRMGSSPLKFDEGIYQNVPPSLMAIDLSKAHHFSYLFVKFRGCIPIWGDFPHLSKT